MQPKDKRKSKKVERKQKKPKYKKSFKKIAMMRKKDMEIQERLDVKDVKSRKQDVAGDAKERKKKKKMDGEKERDAKEKSRKTKGRGLAREEGAQDKNKENGSKGSECGGAGNKSCVPSWPSKKRCIPHCTFFRLIRRTDGDGRDDE